MTRRRKAPRKAQRTRRPQAPAAAGSVPDAEPPAESALRRLVERYCQLAGVKQAPLGADRYELSLPGPERPFFRDRASLRVAFSLAALERDSEAEIGLLGSPFLSQLLDAIRARAARRTLGLIAPTTRSDPAAVALDLPVRDGTARPGAVRLAAHPVGRLIARVVLRAGAGVEETVVESDVHDLATGARLDDELTGLFQGLEGARTAPADPDVAAGATPVPRRPPAELLSLLLTNLREKSGERVAARRAAAEEALAVELARLDRYFEAILAEEAEPEAIATVTALRERRRTEEIRRSDVRAIVHPLQLIEAMLLVQHAEWHVETSRQRRATFSAVRALSGAAGWRLTCPHCGRPPAELVVCRREHGACDACALRCAVCAEHFCVEHGTAECRVDGQPMCDEHARVCPACRLAYCTTHEGTCAEEEHAACSACLAPCGSCGRPICNRHALESSPDAPKGRRRLCSACLRHCEGGANELIGIDEMTQCASCAKAVCTTHQAVCEVDGLVHCSQHLRRTDTSRRLLCARHVATCAQEPAVTLASDEVAPCPVCGKAVCARHRAPCEYCGRHVCTADLASLAPGRGRRPGRRCSTCAHLAAVRDPPDALITAALTATSGRPKSPRVWRMARDRTHVVVEVDLGLTRTTVFTVRHGDSVPDSIVNHSLLGSKRRR